MGVTLHHPHGQVYAYPFVPPVAARELEQQRAYFARHGRGLLADFIADEVAAGVRLLYHGEHAVAFMPICARYSYEVWIAPLRPAASMLELTPAERLDLAAAIKTVLLKCDALWAAPFPYVIHIEIYPAYRMQGRLKYLAGSELGAGVFTADTVPEDTVRDLQRVEVDIHA
jgi:UDPglucose--hexose-1-phosphate uridylyltransferase